nr:penicillin-binding transpeptidase domain-containing protein [bacterium]
KLIPWYRSRRRIVEVAPEEIMIDSSNLPQFNTMQFEGRLEKPISRVTLYILGGTFVLIALIFIGQAWNLQVANGEKYNSQSERNVLRPIPVFAGRGIINDRNGKLLAWNAPTNQALESLTQESSTTERITDDLISTRQYATSTGLSHVLGYVQYPTKDKNGFYFQEDFEGVTGIEKYFNTDLQGENGTRLVEVDARNKIISENIVRPPTQGDSITLSIDSEVQSALFKNIQSIAEQYHFAGGAGVIMDIRTGEIISLTSFPEFSSQVMSDKTDSAQIRALLSNPNLPFLNRAVEGLYTPGSIVKPFVALAALTEKIIDPSTVIVTTGSISIPHPYDTTKSTVFKDWKNHGPINMRQAIAVSSDVYFYTIGGGYKDQKGLGVVLIDKYLNQFGLGRQIPESFAQGKAGTIPTPTWKKATFNEDWYLGNTYHTSIGQYGFQVNLMQMVRAVAAVANSGSLLVPTIVKDEKPTVEKTITDITPRSFQIVREGMRLAVTEGSVKALNVPFVNIAGKSGTAELGVAKDMVNSWISGFWPYENPKYAFVVLLEKGSVKNIIGAAAAMRQQLDWMQINKPEYFKAE